MDVIALYCITRADIPHGPQSAQLMHATREATAGMAANPHEYAIALTEPDEAALEALSFRLFQLGIPHKRIIEPDAPYNGQLMALGIPPMPRGQIGPLLSSCKLVK